RCDTLPGLRTCDGIGQFCLPTPTPELPFLGICEERQGPCETDANRTDPAHCIAGGQNFNRLVAPLVKRNGGATVFTGSGHCVEDLGTPCATSADCGAANFCQDATWHREQGLCRVDDDCPNRQATHCQLELLVHAI